MKEWYLSTTPNVTFVYLPKCDIKLTGIFGNSKKRFLWTGLVHTHKKIYRLGIFELTSLNRKHHFWDINHTTSKLHRVGKGCLKIQTMTNGHQNYTGVLFSIQTMAIKKHRGVFTYRPWPSKLHNGVFLIQTMAIKITQGCFLNTDHGQIVAIGWECAWAHWPELQLELDLHQKIRIHIDLHPND